MLNALRVSKFLSIGSAVRSFSTSRSLAADVAQLTLVGRLTKDPERRLTRNEKEYISYTVVTTHKTSIQGESQYVPTFHRVMCFNPSEIDSVSRLKKGSKVFVQADYSIKEPEVDADPKTPQGQRHIFLIHDNIKVLGLPKQTQEHESTESKTATDFES